MTHYFIEIFEFSQEDSAWAKTSETEYEEYQMVMRAVLDLTEGDHSIGGLRIIKHSTSYDEVVWDNWSNGVEV